MRKIVGIIVAAIVALVGLAAATLIALDWPNRPNPVDVAALKAKASDYDVTISRDGFGVPHIYGPRNADAAFGLAYAHAEDDYATIQTVLLATRGDLAAVEGAKAAPTDYLVQLMRIWDDVDARYESDLPADVRAVLEAYADGINLYAAEHPDAVAPGVLPVTGKDIAAGFVFKTPFFYGLDGVLKDLTAPAEKPGPPKGSNGVAVAPSRSTDGATRLLVNSHQPYIGPVAWYEAVVESGEGWHVAGGFFPGSPFMLHGHNAHLGWANTVNSPDLIDIYRLTINPQNANQYRLDGRWRDFERKDAHLRIKLFGPFFLNLPRAMKWSEHGMVFETDRGAFAVRYAGQRDVRGALQYWRLDQAKNVDEWRAAMALQALPSINYIYADETGLVGYVYNGLFPERTAGVDWQNELPGDRSDLIWTKYKPFDQVPQIWAPKGGVVFNSNNTPFTATALGEGLDPARFAATMGLQQNMTNRAWRALETYGADDQISPEEFRTYKYDVAFSTRSRQMELVREILAMPFDDADLQAGQAILRAWAGRVDRTDRGAALALLSVAVIARAEEDGKPPPDLATSYREAVEKLKTHFGRLDPEWGEVMRFRRGVVDSPIDGGPDTFRAVYGDPQKDGTLTAMAGDTLIMIVTWDANGKLSSESIHQFGSATLDARSPHYADQAPLFVEKRMKPVLFTREQQAGQMKEVYRPGQRKAGGAP